MSTLWAGVAGGVSVAVEWQQIGPHRVACGDALEVLPSLDAAEIAAVITDPPYGIKLSNHAAGKERRNMDWTIAGDGCQVAGSSVLAWAEFNKLPCAAFASPMKPWPGKWRQFLVWEKGEHVSGGGDPGVCWKPSWELLQVARNQELNGSREGSVLRFMANKDDYALHPTPKPELLMEYVVSKLTQPLDTILDPFMGSGTTIVACQRLGRRGIGIEIERRYFDIACKRIERAMQDTAMFDAVDDPFKARELFQ